MNQCKTGLCNRLGELLQKRTQFWLSDMELSYPLQGLMCSEEHRARFKHGVVQGSDTKPAQAYTHDLCSRLTLGVQRLLQCKYQRNKRTPAIATALPATSAASSAVPPPPASVTARRPRRPAAKAEAASSAAPAPALVPDPTAVEPADDAEAVPSAIPEAEWRKCKGCLDRRRADDPSHTRVRGQCKHPDVEPYEWTCPACVKYMPRGHKDHKLDHTCRWSLAPTRKRVVPTV